MVATLDPREVDTTERLRLKRIALGAASALISMNIWTGAPLLALWIGSLVQPDSGLTLGTVGVVIVFLSVEEVALTLLLLYVGAIYDELIGRPKERRRTQRWMLAYNESSRLQQRKAMAPATMVEKLTIASVVSCVLAFEAWFVFLSQYSYRGY